MGKKKNNITVAICAIGRWENSYAVEWVDYYKNLGFDCIHIYDNNRDDDEYFEEVLDKYIKDGLVVIHDMRNVKEAQLSAYQDFSDKYLNNYTWAAYIDFDEFITLKKHDNIKEYLSQDKFNDFDQIRLNWMLYGSCGKTKREEGGVIERFPDPLDFDIKIGYDFPENNHVKCLIRGNKKCKWEDTPHTPSNDFKSCNNCGSECKDSTSPFEQYDFTEAYIRHYVTKSEEEFKRKAERGYPDRNSIPDWRYKFAQYDPNTVPSHTKVDIFICTHKDYQSPVGGLPYRQIDNRLFDPKWANSKFMCCQKGNPGLFYSEILSYFYVFEHVKIKEYIGFCQYRRYFSFLNDVGHIVDDIEKHGVIVPQKLYLGMPSVEFYSKYHSGEDIKLLREIIRDLYPQFLPVFDDTMYDEYMYGCNMFIMKREDFVEYITMMWSILQMYLCRIGGPENIIERIANPGNRYFLNNGTNEDIRYQYRIGGYLAERITNMFIRKKFPNPKEYPMIITAEKKD